MPVPLLFVGAAATAVVAAGGIVAYLSKEFERKTKDRRIAVVGPRMAGKSSTLAALRGDPVDLTYKPTAFPKTFTFPVDTSKLGATATDLAGDKDARGQWSKEIESAGLVVVVVSASQLLSYAGEAEARSAANYVAGVPRTAKSRTILLVTHPDETELAAEPHALAEHERVRDVARIVGAGRDVVIANLTDADDQEKVRRKIAEALR